VSGGTLNPQSEADTDPDLLCDIDDGVGLLTINRPEKRNALTATRLGALLDLIEDLDGRPEVRAIVVTGAGPDFSAGGEGNSQGFVSSKAERDAARLGATDRRWPWQLRTPVVGALNGSAVGGALSASLQWDIRFMAEDAKYGFVFTRRGVTPELNALWILPRLVGSARAADLLLSGRLFTGADALSYGLAAFSMPRTEVLPAALEYAHDLARYTSACAVANAKLELYESLGSRSRLDSFHAEHSLFEWLRDSEDAREGMTSFLERRPPEFGLGKHDSPTPGSPSGVDR
jgi:enoyl-CoA hydratase/carnithine racemase